MQQWQLSIEKLYMIRRVGGTAWSHDGKQIAFISNISGRNNLWLAPAEGGWPVQLTISDQRQASPAWSPDGKWIAYISDHDGDEQWDIFLVSPANGEVVNLTNTPAISEESPAWAPDGRHLAYQVKPQTSSTFEIDVMDILTRKVRHLTTGTPAELGNNSSHLVARRQVDRLHPAARRRQGLQHLRGRGRDRQEHAGHAA